MVGWSAVDNGGGPSYLGLHYIIPCGYYLQYPSLFLSVTHTVVVPTDAWTIHSLIVPSVWLAFAVYEK